MTTHDAFQSAGAAPLSPGVFTRSCAFTSSSAGMRRMRSTGVTVSTFTGLAAEQEAPVARDGTRSCFFSSSTSVWRGLAERAGELSLGKDRLETLDRIREITIHVVASHSRWHLLLARAGARPAARLQRSLPKLASLPPNSNA